MTPLEDPPPSGPILGAGVRSKATDTEVVAEQPSALVPPDVLQGGEVILLILKPSTWFILLECIKSLTAFFLITMIALTIGEHVATPLGRSDIVLLGVGAGGVRLFWQFLEWLGRVYILTDRRVICVCGVTKVVIHDLGIKQLRDTELHHSGRENATGLGSIVFLPSKAELHPVRWRMIDSPHQTFETVRRLINRYR